MLIAHKEIGEVTHRLVYHSPEYSDHDRVSCFSSEYPEEYYFTQLTPQLWELFRKEGFAWGYREHLRWEPEPPDPDNPNQIHFSDFKDPMVDAETRQREFTVTELKVGN